MSSHPNVIAFPHSCPQAKVKAYELRSNNKGALLKKLDELKNELGQVTIVSNN